MKLGAAVVAVVAGGSLGHYLGAITIAEDPRPRPSHAHLDVHNARALGELCPSAAEETAWLTLAPAATHVDADGRERLDVVVTSEMPQMPVLDNARIAYNISLQSIHGVEQYSLTSSALPISSLSEGSTHHSLPSLADGAYAAILTAVVETTNGHPFSHQTSLFLRVEEGRLEILNLNEWLDLPAMNDNAPLVQGELP